MKPRLQKSPDFDVVIKLRNNHLVAFRESMGWSVAQAAEKMGVSYVTYVEYENLRRSPLSYKYPGKWKKSALRVAEYFQVSPDEIWPEAIQRVKQRCIQLKLDGPQALALAGVEMKQLPAPDEFVEAAEMKTFVHAALDKLTPRERSILERRFGLTGKGPHTLEELSEADEVTRERIRQLENRAMWKIRHGTRAPVLREFVAREGDRNEPS